MRISLDAVLKLAQAASVGITPCLTGRCRYHGGKSTGAKNPRIKHGMYTKAAMEEIRMINEFIREANQVTGDIVGL